MSVLPRLLGYSRRYRGRFAAALAAMLLYGAAPEGRAGEALGLRTTLLNFSQTVIPLLSGALGAAFGMAPVFWTMAVVLAAGAAYARRR